MPGMDELRADDASADGTVAQALREMLEQATAVDPPIGTTAHDALWPGSGARTTVMPISAATDTAGPPIPGIHSGARALVIAP